jgi:hypothetical protein
MAGFAKLFLFDFSNTTHAKSPKSLLTTLSRIIYKETERLMLELKCVCFVVPQQT